MMLLLRAYSLCVLCFSRYFSNCGIHTVLDCPFARALLQILVTLREIKASGVVPGAPAKRTAAQQQADALAASKAAALAQAQALQDAEAQSAFGKATAAAAAASAAAVAHADAVSWQLEPRELVCGAPCECGLPEDYIDCRWRSKMFCARRWSLPAAAAADASADGALPAAAAAVVQRFANLRHPNVQLFVGVCPNRKAAETMLVFEEASRGTLAHTLASLDRAFEWETSVAMALDVACGLAFLHGAQPPVRMPHLSSHTVLVTDGMRCKLANVFEGALEKALGSAPYRRAPPTLQAPEVATATAQQQMSSADTVAAAAATDVFNFGTVLWEIFAGGSETALAAACDAAAEGLAKVCAHSRSVILALSFTHSLNLEHHVSTSLSCPLSLSGHFPYLITLSSCPLSAPAHDQDPGRRVRSHRGVLGRRARQAPIARDACARSRKISQGRPVQGNVAKRKLARELNNSISCSCSSCSREFLQTVVIQLTLSFDSYSLLNSPSHLQLVLSAANARRHHKAKLVLAFRSADAVSIQKKWGKSRGNEGCFVVSGDSEGGDASQGDDVYCIDADAFATTYTRVGGALWCSQLFTFSTAP